MSRCQGRDEMKRVLITGAGSYIGTAFESWIAERSDSIITQTLGMRGEAWRGHDFRGYDSVFHVAGLAHADVGKVSEETKALYYKVNCDLAVECARKAKAEGVGQFIFMSSIIVYGDSAGIGKRRVIGRDTPLAPANFYGDSKVRAEEGLKRLDSDSFRVVILRPPMIYGKGSKGNYPLLAKLAVKLPFFPKEENQRSMLYIGNLCRFVELMVENGERGIFYPQNAEYVDEVTTDYTVWVDDNYLLEIRQFCDAVLNGTPLAVSEEESLRTARVSDAIRKAGGLA